MLQRLKIRSAVYGAIIFSIVFQFSGSSAALAVDEFPSLPGISTLPAPIGGSPHSAVQKDSDFSFVWHAVDSESAIQYQLRVSDDLAQVGKASDSSSAWYSEKTLSAAMPANVAPLHDGLWYWQVRALTTSDKSPWSEVWSVRIDTIGPVISISQPLEGSIGNEQISFLAEIADKSDIVNVAVELDDQNITDQITQESSSKGLRLSREWMPGQLAEGDHALRVSAADMLGHSSELVRQFKIDTTAPDVTVSVVEDQVLNGVVPIEIHGNEAGVYAIRIASDGKEIFAGGNADSPQESPLSYKYAWNTWSVSNSTYDITFTARASLNNDVNITRRVNIANIPIAGVIVNDPLLEELSAQLNQPLITPKVTITAAPTAIVADPPKVNDLSPEQEVFLKTVPDFVPVVATENGWRLFGVLWYWWLLGGFVLAGAAMAVKRNMRASFSQVPDRV